MQSSLKCSLSLVLALGLCHMCLAMPGRYIRAADDDSLVTLQFEDNEKDLNPINSEKPIKVLIPANTTLKEYPEDTPIFDRSSVSLELPDRLFTNTFSTASNVSKVLGTFIMNSARRFSIFAYFFKPIFGDALVIRDTAAELAFNMTSSTVEPEPLNEDTDFEFTTLAVDTTTFDSSFEETTMNSIISNEI